MNKKQVKHTINIYNQVLNHLVEHLNEGNFDNLDVQQSKMLINEINNLSKLKGGSNDLLKWSDPNEAQKQAFKYLGPSAILYKSEHQNKKYKIFDPFLNKWVHFGQMGYEDFTRHQNLDRRASYLARATNMRGNWRNNPYSANNLSINILW